GHAFVCDGLVRWGEAGEVARVRPSPRPFDRHSIILGDEIFDNVMDVWECSYEVCDRCGERGRALLPAGAGIFRIDVFIERAEFSGTEAILKQPSDDLFVLIFISIVHVILRSSPWWGFEARRAPSERTGSALQSIFRSVTSIDGTQRAPS